MADDIIRSISAVLYNIIVANRDYFILVEKYNDSSYDYAINIWSEADYAASIISRAEYVPYSRSSCFWWYSPGNPHIVTRGGSEAFYSRM